MAGCSASQKTQSQNGKIETELLHSLRSRQTFDNTFNMVYSKHQVQIKLPTHK